MTKTINAAANAAPANDCEDPVNVSKPSKKHLRASSEAHEKTATSSAFSKCRNKAGDTAAAEAPPASNARNEAPEQPRQTKASVVEALLTRQGGASLEALCEATGWQAHTCRAFLTGLRKKGREVIRASDRDGKATYLIAQDRSNEPSPAAGQTKAENN